MSKPKRHHFVPQFYLRRFSSDGRSICCYNKGSQRFIKKASIKGQCAIDNYYSWNDGVEPMLGIIEGRVAAIVRQIAATERLPDLNSAEWQELLRFIALQAGRTKISGDTSDALADYLAKLMAQGNPELDGYDLSQVRLKSRYPAALPMEVAIEGYRYLNSLGRALLINATKMPFICSDNPVVFYNSQRSRLKDEGVIGLDSSGLQIFFALDPHRAVYLYDEQIYGHPTSIGVRKLRLDDVAKMNIVHYLWSDKNVYVSSVEHEEFIRELCKETMPFRSYARVCYLESERIDKDNGNQGSLLVNFRAQPPVEVEFGFAKHTKVLACNDMGMRSIKYDVASDTRSGGTTYRFASGASGRAHLKGIELKKALKALTRYAA